MSHRIAFTIPIVIDNVQSGHAAEALYAVLTERGFMPKEWMEKVGLYLSPVTGHPYPCGGRSAKYRCVGHGLPMAVGMAIAGKLDSRAYRVFCLSKEMAS